MIFPGNLFEQKLKPDLSPAWVLSALNLLVFIVIAFNYADPIKDYKKEEYREKTAKLKEMYIQTLDPLEKHVAASASLQSIIRDSKFWIRAQKFPFKGDVVQIEETKNFLNDLRLSYYRSPQFVFGLSPTPTTSWAWITYQFVHAGFFHLITNVLFLFLIASALQKCVSETWVYAVYISSGIAGGVAYLYMNQFNEIAVLGASGAICGLMAFLSVVLNYRNMEWSYFVSPLRGYYGLIYMPAFLLFPMYLVSDFTTIIYYNAGVQSSVAHSAHIGGTLAGFILGVAYLYDKKFKNHILNMWGKQISPQEYSELRDRAS